jgi:hypothetical protein
MDLKSEKFVDRGKKCGMLKGIDEDNIILKRRKIRC